MIIHIMGVRSQAKPVRTAGFTEAQLAELEDVGGASPADPSPVPAERWTSLDDIIEDPIQEAFDEEFMYDSEVERELSDMCEP